MNRLTQKNDRGEWSLKGVSWKQLMTGEKITRITNSLLYGALYKLMRYEDTGLSPDQIKEMDELYREKCREVAELQKKHRWIPAEEQLPGLDEVVLVQVSGKPAENITLYDAVELAEYNPDEGWILEAYQEWEDAAPVAWMPLPELYQAVKTEP